MFLEAFEKIAKVVKKVKALPPKKSESELDPKIPDAQRSMIEDWYGRTLPDYNIGPG